MGRGLGVAGISLCMPAFIEARGLLSLAMDATAGLETPELGGLGAETEAASSSTCASTDSISFLAACKAAAEGWMTLGFPPSGPAEGRVKETNVGTSPVAGWNHDA